jgi:hypothetical protein
MTEAVMRNGIIILDADHVSVGRCRERERERERMLHVSRADTKVTLLDIGFVFTLG